MAAATINPEKMILMSPSKLGTNRLKGV